MIKHILLGCIFFAAIANTLPSPAALHPTRTALGFSEADIAGTGREAPTNGRSASCSKRDDAAAAAAREMRDLARRCRSLAKWMNEADREVLLTLADEYEAKAAAYEARRRS